MKQLWILVLWVMMNDGTLYRLDDANSWSVDSASFGDVRTIDFYSGDLPFDIDNSLHKSHRVSTYLAKQVKWVSRQPPVKLKH